MNAPRWSGELTHPSGLPVDVSMVECDRGGCPALAVHEVDLYDQDFFFCHHHWVELVAHLPARGLTPPADPRPRVSAPV